MVASRRAQLAMTAKEIADFIDAHCHLVVGTNGPGGAPHLVTVSYGVRDGVIGFWAYRKSQKVANLRRDDRITCLLEQPGSSYAEIRGIQIVGTALLVEDAAEVADIGALVVANVARFRALPSVVDSGSPDATATGLAAKRVGVWVQPQRIISWDHRRLNGGY